MRFDRPKALEWVQPVRKGYKLACCDCGLVHSLDFRVVKRRVQFRADRNERSTALSRRGRLILAGQSKFVLKAKRALQKAGLW